MPEIPLLFHRQDLLLLDRSSEFACNHSDKDIIRDWISASRPVIVRRPGTISAGIHCGIPLPPSRNKQKIAFVVGRNAVRQKLKLPNLAECLSYLPEEHRRILCGFGAVPEVFGSLAWEHLTGLPYLHENSDIDLLFRVSNQNELRNLMVRLKQLNAEFCDIEIILWDGRAFSWREFCGDSHSVIIRTDHSVFLLEKRILMADVPDDETIASIAVDSLYEELETYPKPGLVTYIDNGSHRDMDAGHFLAGISVLYPCFQSLAAAGRRGASMAELRSVGIDAERRMLDATGGVNTHRGAIFSLGLLVAASAYKSERGIRSGLGEIVRDLWGREIMELQNPDSHGEQMANKYGCDGAQSEAASGFCSVYEFGLPAMRSVKNDRNAARIRSFFSMLEHVKDSTLLYRGGIPGRDYAVAAARDFNCGPAVDMKGWEEPALKIHMDFVGKNLSCGGVADLLAATIFIDRMEEICPS